MAIRDVVVRCKLALAFYFKEAQLDPGPVRAGWPEWDAALIEFFGMKPIDNGEPPLEYFRRHNIRHWDTSLDMVQALHAFHEHHFRIGPTLFAAFHRYTRLYDQVPPFTEEEPMTESDWRKHEMQYESFDPRNPMRRRATIFGAGAGDGRSGGAGGIKKDDPWAIEREGRLPRDR